MRAVRETTPADIPMLRTLFATRGLPARLLRRPTLAFTSEPVIDQFLRGGFLVLGNEPDRELVIGAVHQPWRLVGGGPLAIRDATEFREFWRPGFVKSAMNFRVEPGATGEGSVVETETRIFATDRAARRRFRLYWLLVGPGSGLIRRMWLRSIRRRAEAM